MSELTLNKSLEFLKNLKLGDASYNSKVQKLYMQIYECKKLISEIENFADEYTFEHQSECGFRSIIKVFLCAVSEALSACNQPKWIWKIFYSKKRQIKNLQLHCDILDNFMKMFRNLHIIHKKSAGTGCLITDEAVYDNVIAKTLQEVNLKCFYGTQIGFYHSSPTKLQSRFFIVAMTTFSDFFYSAQHLTVRLLRVPISMIKYTIYPALCAQRADEMIRNIDIDVMKIGMLFFMSKISCFFQNLFHHRLAVNKILKISPEPLQIRSSKAFRLIDIPVPSSHIKSSPIPCRLLSATKRRGMVGEENSKHEMSKHLIIHAHGGGFYTHTSASHEIYLRSWAHHLDIPILAIEYSLTPEAPFPRAIEEIFYVYCWVLKTGGKLLGTTAENVIFVGDSAGANLTMAVIIKCIETGVPIPKGFLSVYGLFLSNYATIPSRMLGIFDIFLTYSMTARIFKTYAGFFKQREIVKNGKIPLAPENEFDDKIPKNHLMSPIWTPDEILRQFPKVRLLTTEFDPLLDENIEMAKKLRTLNVDVQLDTLHGLLHGFLHLIRLDKRSFEGSMKCVNHMRELFEIN